VSILKTNTPSKNLGKQFCAEGFNSGVKGLMPNDLNRRRAVIVLKNNPHQKSRHAALSGGT
jgi:hypothetical protein